LLTSLAAAENPVACDKPETKSRFWNETTENQAKREYFSFLRVFFVKERSASPKKA
jgi:hypothetical protein